jgi:hypothetical protein
MRGLAAHRNHLASIFSEGVNNLKKQLLTVCVYLAVVTGGVFPVWASSVGEKAGDEMSPLADRIAQRSSGDSGVLGQLADSAQPSSIVLAEEKPDKDAQPSDKPEAPPLLEEESGSKDAPGDKAKPKESPEVAPDAKPFEAPPTSEVMQLKSKIIDLQNKGKLGFQKILACGRVDGYGVYSALTGPLDNVTLYAEPANVSTLVSDGRYVIKCSVDLAVIDHQGKVVAAKKNIVEINKVTQSPLLDVYVAIPIKVRKDHKDSVSFQLVLHDHIKNQTARATYRFNIKKKDKTRIDGV